MDPLKNLKEAELGALIRGLAQDVVDAHIHWGQLVALQNELDARPEVGAEAWTFWYFTLVAHRQTVLAALARVFDKQKTSLHMHSLLVAIRGHLHLFDKDGVLRRRPEDPFAQLISSEDARPDPVQLDLDIESCTNSDDDVKALRAFRGSQLAHRGATLARQDDVTKLPPLFVEQVERLLQKAHSLLNRYSFMFDNSGYSTTPLGHDDVKHVFECVQRDLDRQKVEAES